MKCYYTGEECDCGGDMETECPYDVMDHDDDIFDAVAQLETERRFADLSEQLEANSAR